MKNKIFFITFISIWIILIILNFAIPNKSFSEQENRYLAKMPKFSFEQLTSGEYQKKLESYINDHFVFRNIWIKIKSQEERILGKTENNDVYIGKDGYLFEKFKYGEDEKSNLKNITEIVNKFADKQEKPIYFILVPNSIYINQDKLPNYVDAIDQNEIINNFYENLNSNIKKINVTKTLQENKDDYLYFRTDHHMTSNGAYLVYKEFNKKALPLSQYDKKIVSNSFLGTFDSKAQILNQKPDEIVIYENENNKNIKEAIYDNETTKSIYNEHYLDTKDKYSYFLNGNNAKSVVKTNVENNKKLLVLKDSYSHIMAQFLCNDYQEIHFIDPRYYKDSMSKYIEENNIDEILFLYNVSNLTTDMGLRNLK